MFTLMPARLLKKKTANAWSSVQDTFYSTKDIFERHRVVFTVSTSIASVATAWVGYSLRVFHQSKVENRLDSIEQALERHSQLEKTEIKKDGEFRQYCSYHCWNHISYWVWPGMERRTMESSQAVQEGAIEIDGEDKTKNMAKVNSANINNKSSTAILWSDHRHGASQFVTLCR